MTLEEYNTIDEAFKEAEKDDTPFLVATEDELVVVGDANKTQLNIHDFEVEFRVPQEQECGKVVYKNVKKEINGVYITPRMDADIVKALTVLLPFYKAVRRGQNGTINVADLTDEEKKQIAKSLTQEIYDAMYDLVSVVLRIDPAIKDYMLPISVMDNTAKIIRGYAEVVNEADTFFE